ncbi:two-component system sensor histidine kinase NtrB [Aerolutibacter ruishenii]|uniref:histidine kinase n=1 Tax=Aerolutibacter ruishenii TaxID=686800 RepID=A0A562M0X8_9GAMM|nr:ATP-binding protein [Lysobacter ruishenii]TWI13540.1 two-component system nitrogen regulation sensor histidine kinase GlnL [Lysobacter ruishenii]
MTGTAPELESLTTPVAWLDAVGVIAGCNQAFARWLGVGARRLVGWPLVGLDGGDERLATALARVAIDDGAPLRVRRLGLCFPDGAPRFADLWLSRRDDGGTLVEAHPVDEFPGEDPAQVLPSALSAALKGLAHELRNPLAGVKGAAQLLARRAAAREDNADERELLALIDGEVARLTGLLDRLLNPAPPQAHALLNIHAVLERVLRLAEADAGWAVQLVRDYDPSLPEFDGDADRLQQALWNLVRNAIEAGATHITLRTRADHGLRLGDELHPVALRLEISDDGRGVPEELAERLFLPLVTGRAEGTGLGLALAQQVAREHRGTLVYRSRPGHTVFTLHLPMRLPEPPVDVADEATMVPNANDDGRAERDSVAATPAAAPTVHSPIPGSGEHVQDASGEGRDG